MNTQEGYLCFKFQDERPEEFLTIPFHWSASDIYTLIIRRHEVEIVEQYGEDKPSTYAKQARHFRLDTPYWVHVCLMPDRMMPAYPRIAVYFWKEGKSEPKSTTFPYPSRPRRQKKKPREFKGFLRQETIGFQTDTLSNITHDIQECEIEYWDGTTETVWRRWDVAIPLTQEKYRDFLFEKPRVDIPSTTGKVHTGLGWQGIRLLKDV